MNAPLVPLFPRRFGAASTDSVRCPLREGPPTLDALLAELGRDRDGSKALDLALELRYAFHVTEDATACAALALQLSQALGERHYLAHYRVRLWLTRMLAVEIRGYRGDPWVRFPLPLVVAPSGPTEELCLTQWTQDNPRRSADLAQVRYVFTVTTESAVTESHAPA